MRNLSRAKNKFFAINFKDFSKKRENFFLTFIFYHFLRKLSRAKTSFL
nr:MAG TPA: hypothetical protein [Caudoviricetes sp.]